MRKLSPTKVKQNTEDIFTIKDKKNRNISSTLGSKYSEEKYFENEIPSFLG